MKSYSTKAVASMQAGCKSKKTGEKYIAVQDNELWIVGTTQEIADLIADREAEKATALFAAQQAAADSAAIVKDAECAAPQPLDPEVKGVVITGQFHRQTNEMVAIFMKGPDRSPSWFKRKDLLSLVAIDDTLVLTVPDGFKHSGKTYKAA